MKNRIFIAIGFVCVVLGAVGIFVPVLPTTPFLLLASWLFFKANSRWREWLLAHPRLGPYISNYIKYRAIPLRSKISTIALLWATILLSIALVDPLWLKILLLTIAIGVTIHIVTLKTL